MEMLFVGAFSANLGPQDVRWIVQGLIILILSIAVHEFGHAWVADRLGDRLPRSQGRVTLNPIAHADPIGTLALPIVSMVITGGQSLGFGWGRPVQVNPTSFTRKLRMRTAHMLVAAAGPAMNVVLGVVIAGVHAALVGFDVIAVYGKLSEIIAYASLINFVLAFFNLIPAPPLDGGAVVEGLLPYSALDTWHKVAVYGPFIVMAFIMIPGASKVFVVPALWLHTHLYGLLDLPRFFGL